MPRKQKTQSQKIDELTKMVKDMKLAKSPSSYAPRMRGRGFYKGFGRDAGSFIGSVASKLSGVPALDRIGGFIGDKAAKMTGFGAYNVNSNSVLSPQAPIIYNDLKIEGATIIRHQEYIGDLINTSTGFSVDRVLTLNPGLDETFPWLSQVAGSYQQYKWLGVVVMFKSTSGELTTSQALGEVMISTQYDVLDAPFTSKVEMLGEYFSSSGKPSNDLLHGIECQKSQTPLDKLYVRTTAVPSNASAQLYDFAKVSVGTQNQVSAGLSLGELWISYEVALFKPTINNPPSNVGQLALYNFTTTAGSPTNQATAFGTAYSVVDDTIGIQYDVANQSILIPAGSGSQFLFQLEYRGGTTGGGWFGSNPVSPGVSALTLSNAQVLSGTSTITYPASNFSSATSTAVLNIVNPQLDTVITNAGTYDITPQIDCVVNQLRLIRLA